MTPPRSPIRVRQRPQARLASLWGIGDDDDDESESSGDAPDYYDDVELAQARAQERVAVERDRQLAEELEMEEHLEEHRRREEEGRSAAQLARERARQRLIDYRARQARLQRAREAQQQ